MRDLLLRSRRASSAYLTVSEIFPLEVRAQAIAVFFSIAQGVGAIGPILYGSLIGEGDDPTNLFIGYLLAAGVMVVGAVVEVFLGIDAEQQSLESVATPLSAVQVGQPPDERLRSLRRRRPGQDEPREDDQHD